jgi:hypothetical protein
MKSILRTATLASCLIFSLPAVEPKPMTNADVVSMVKAELPESTIILAIQKGSAAFDSSPHALIGLKGDRVTPKIIEAMLNSSTKPIKEDENPAPSEADIKKLFEEIAQEQSSGVVTVVSFKKTNGQMGVQNGVQQYVMTFELVVGFSRSCIWLNVPFDPKLTFKVAAAPVGNDLAAFAQIGTNPGLQVKGGTAFLISGEARFEKMERGWRPVFMVRTDLRTTNLRDIRREEAKNEQVEQNASRRRALPDFAAKDLEALMKTPARTPQVSSPLVSAQNGKISVAQPPEFTPEKSRNESDIRLVRLNPDGLKDIILVNCKPTALLNRNPSVDSVLAGWRAGDQKQNPESVVSEGISTQLLGLEARSYVCEQRRERHGISPI